MRRNPQVEKQRDYEAYRETMYQKAKREGMADTEARAYANKMVEEQSNQGREKLAKLTATRLKWRGYGRQ